MTIINWQTDAGSIGAYPAGSEISFQFSATSENLSSDIRYKLLSGTFPNGTITNPLVLSKYGLLSGTLNSVTEETQYSFTIRAYDQFGTIRDRTFNIGVSVPNPPSLTKVPNLLFTCYDSTWTNVQVPYKNPTDTNIVTFKHTSGTLPEGLYLTTDGKIQGYAKPPFSEINDPIVKRYVFTIELTSMLGNDSAVYSVDVINQNINKPYHTRIPVIYNSRPLYNPISTTDPYYGFYCGPDNVIPTIRANEYFSFKILGKDFDNDPLKFNFGPLPPGLKGDSLTGYITGKPTMLTVGINDYQISVSVSKRSYPSVTSPIQVFKLRVLNKVVEDIVWVTNENLGVIYNNTISELSIKATSSKELVYVLVDGKLPPNLQVQSNGLISGRVAAQPSSSLLQQDDITEYNFTVLAYSLEQNLLRSQKTFKIIVKQYYGTAIENVYFKITSSIQGKNVLKSLLTNTNLIPNEYLYRPGDFYFGKPTDIKIVHAYGVESSTLPTYLNAIQKNHYNKSIVLGPLKTARALDNDGNPLYEVVYSEIIDDQINSDGVSISEEITWPVKISLNLGSWNINNTNLYISSNNIYISYSPGYVRELYPNSIQNMYDRLIANIGQNSDNRLLPKWMTSQQENGETLGFTRCWVICYTVPGKASTIKDNINNNWNHSLNEIDCTLDRFYVDKSSTYNWNNDLLIPTWNELPSEIPNYTNPEKHDLPVLFPRKTILPKDNNY